MPSAPAQAAAADELTAAACALPRSARMRLVSALLAAEGDAEGAADYEAAARDAEMDEDPARFIAKGSHRAFIAKLRADILRRSRRKKSGKSSAKLAASA